MKQPNEIAKSRCLVFCIGNNGRRDDGLGWAFADRLMNDPPAGMDVEYRYQLQVEDAWLLAQYSRVLFVDASQEKLPVGFAVRPCRSAAQYFFSSHHQSPETLLYLAAELYQSRPEAFTLAIAGTDWGLGTGLSPAANEHLDKAFCSVFSTGWPFGAEQNQLKSAETPF